MNKFSKLFFLICLICSLHIFTLQTAFATTNTPSTSLPSVEYCQALTQEIIIQSDDDRIQGCQCLSTANLKKEVQQQIIGSKEICNRVNTQTHLHCVYPENPQYTLETFKKHDYNNNCKIDDNNEICQFKVTSKYTTSTASERNQLQEQKYGCYGTSNRPQTLQQYLEGDRGNTANQRVDVFDQRTGLIASEGQLQKLTNIAKAQGGPVIGFFNFIIDYLVSIVFVLCMASLIYGGYNLIFSGFDQDMAEKGKKAIQYAIYGFLFIMLSYTIVLLIQSIF